MNGRVKLQIWSDAKQRWRTAYCLVTLLHESLLMAKAHGLTVRVGSACR
jgi:hypothetical protein